MQKAKIGAYIFAAVIIAIYPLHMSGDVFGAVKQKKNAIKIHVAWNSSKTGIDIAAIQQAKIWKGIPRIGMGIEWMHFIRSWTGFSLSFDYYYNEDGRKRGINTTIYFNGAMFFDDSNKKYMLKNFISTLLFKGDLYNMTILLGPGIGYSLFRFNFPAFYDPHKPGPRNPGQYFSERSSMIHMRCSLIFKMVMIDFMYMKNIDIYDHRSQNLFGRRNPFGVPVTRPDIPENQKFNFLTGMYLRVGIIWKF